MGHEDSPPARKAWIAAQVILAVLWVLSNGFALSSFFALPQAEYVARYGPPGPELSQCEAIAMPPRRGMRPVCAMFGSAKTHPFQFSALLLVSGLTSWALWQTVRRGKGVRVERER